MLLNLRCCEEVWKLNPTTWCRSWFLCSPSRFEMNLGASRRQFEIALLLAVLSNPVKHGGTRRTYVQKFQPRKPGTPRNLQREAAAGTSTRGPAPALRRRLWRWVVGRFLGSLHVGSSLSRWRLTKTSSVVLSRLSTGAGEPGERSSARFSQVRVCGVERSSSSSTGESRSRLGVSLDWSL